MIVVQLCFVLVAEKAGAEGSTFTDFGAAYVPVAELREITASFHSLLNNISVVSAPKRCQSLLVWSRLGICVCWFDSVTTVPRGCHLQGGMQIEPEALLGKPDDAFGPQSQIVPEAGASADTVNVEPTSDAGMVAAAEDRGPSLKPEDSDTLTRLLRNVDCSRVFTWLGVATMAEDTGDRQYDPVGQEAILLLRVVASGATMLRAGLVSFRHTSNADQALCMMTCSAEKDPWHPLVDTSM